MQASAGASCGAFSSFTPLVLHLQLTDGLLHGGDVLLHGLVGRPLCREFTRGSILCRWRWSGLRLWCSWRWCCLRCPLGGRRRGPGGARLQVVRQEGREVFTF